MHLASIINSDEYAFEDPDELEMIWENGVRLSEIPFEHAKYTYDFGDTPPEDVGGESGYEYFLGIMSDPDDEEHEDFKLWAEEQRFRKYDLVYVKKADERLFGRY